MQALRRGTYAGNARTLAPMNVNEVVFDDGARTVLETWGSTGPTLVCVHGMTSSRKAWTRLAQRLAGRYRVAAYDQRGHGDATSSDSSMPLWRHVRDLQTIVDTIGGDVQGLIGHSWGGAVVILGGLDSRARGIVAIDPVLRVTPGTWRADYLDDAETLFALPPAGREEWVRSALAGWDPVDIEGKLHAVARMTAEPIARLGTDNDVDHGGWDIRRTVESYPKPLLVLAAGPDDSVMSGADVAHVKTKGGPNVRAVDFPDEGHNLHRTAFDAFAMEVESFFGRFV